MTARQLGRSIAVEARHAGALWLASTVLLLSPAAGAVILTDDEPANNALPADMTPAPIVIFKTGVVTIAAGELALVAGDIDFLGIAALSTGDVVTVTTTPLDDPNLVIPNLEDPDTIVGLFDSSTTDPTFMILCRGDDTANFDPEGAGEPLIGKGSLCRFEILAPGNYWVGVTGFRAMFPVGCDPALGECSKFPFDSGIGTTPCLEEGEVDVCGNYQVTIAVHSLPEPTVLLQLGSGIAGLALLGRHRRRSQNEKQGSKGDVDVTASTLHGSLNETRTVKCKN